MRVFVLSLGLCLFASLLGGPAFASPGSQARKHYESGSAHFAVGEFAQAAEEYQEAYKLKQDPALLYNAAQAFRLAGNLDRALILYRNYLQFFPRSENIDEVRLQITKLQEAIAANQQAKQSPPTNTVEPAKTDATPAVTPEPTTPESKDAGHESLSPGAPQKGAISAAEKKPIYKKWWLWTIVGGVVAAAVVVPVVVVSTSSSWGNLPNQSFARVAVQW